MKALLFDLGGVLVDIDFGLAFIEFEKQSNLSIDEIKARFEMDNMYRLHETGHIAWPQYSEHLRGTLKLNATDEDIAVAWNSIFKDEVAQTVTAIKSLSDKVQCFVFSNTNPTHQQFWLKKYPNVVALFKQVFVSSELGLRKPDAASFKAISSSTQCELENFTFFDDTLENVEAARKLGMHAVWVQHPDDVTSELDRSYS